jgi:predicted PurR-regulated permease PerM
MPRFESQTRFWLIALVLFGLALWILKSILLPFLTGMAIAYFLNPVVDYLARRKVPRWIGALGVLACFIIIAGLIIVLIFPVLQDQIGAFINAVPGYVQDVRDYYSSRMQNWLSRMPAEDMSKLRAAASQSVGQAAGWAAQLLQQIVTGGFAIIDILALMIVTPVVAFYMLRDWPILTANLDAAIPRTHYALIRDRLMEIDSTLSGFIRGQALVSLTLGTLYTVGLSVVGLHYGAAIGVSAGILTFVPYVGTIFGWVTSLLLAFSQFDDWTHIAMVLAVFLVGHILEAYVLTPRLVGHRVGLHPVWVLFALIAGAKLLGFTGVLIAVPTAAVLGVLIRFGFSEYKKSAFYKDNHSHSRS